MANGGGEPWWLTAAKTFGFPALLVAYLLGMLPGTSSPFDRLSKQLEAAAQAMTAHEATAVEQLRVARHICRALWKGDAVLQGQCDR